MLIGGSVSGGQAAEAVTAAHRGTAAHPGTAAHRAGARPGTAQRAAAHPAAAQPVPGGAMKRVRFGGYTLEVPAGWPVYRLARDPGRCVRYDRHAVYLGQPGADQQCPAHLVGRTETISVARPGGRPPVHGCGGRCTAARCRAARCTAAPRSADCPGRPARSPAMLPGTSCTPPWAGAGLSITGTYGGSPREVLSIIRSVRPVTAARSARHGSGSRARHHAPARQRAAGHAPARHAPVGHAAGPGGAGLVLAGSAQALSGAAAGPATDQSARGPRHHRPGHRPATTGPATTGGPATAGPVTTGPVTTGPVTTAPGATGPGTAGRGRTGPDTTGPVASRRRARCTVSTAARPPRWP